MQIEINNRQYKCHEGMTLLQVCRKEGIYLPTLCHIPGKEKRSVCRMCSVQTDTSDCLVTACSTKVQENMKVWTNSGKVVMTQKILMELILEEHGTCNNKNCEVESLAKTLGVSIPNQSQKVEANGKLDAVLKQAEFSDYIKVDREKCIHCDRCIRSCEKGIIKRAKYGDELSMSFENDFDFQNDKCTLCGDCEKVCPAGVYQLMSIGN